VAAIEKRKEKKKETLKISVITISREPGSGGNILAKLLAEKLDFDLFCQEVVHEIAKSALVSARILETLDEKGDSVLEKIGYRLWCTSNISGRISIFSI
jgi:cytidylate kinase